MSEKNTDTSDGEQNESQTIDRRSYLKLAGATSTGLGTSIGASALNSELMTRARAATTSLDDFEDGDISEYSGHTSYYSVQSSTTLEGSYTLKGDKLYGELGHDNVTTPRGYEYRYRMQAGSSSAKPCMLVCVQDTAYPQNDCYQVFPDPSSGSIEVQLRQNNEWQKDVISESFAFDAGTEYQIGIKLKSSSIQVVVYDSGGSTLHTTAEVSESTWSGGNLGFYIGGDTPGYFDDVRKIDLGDSSGGSTDLFRDGFEDGDLTEWDGNTSLFSVQSSTVLEGNYTLRCDDNYGSIGHSSFSVSRGNEYRVQIQAGTDTKPSLLTCAQDSARPLDDCYWAIADPSKDELGLYLRQNGSTTQLATVSNTIELGVTYKLSIQLTDSSVRAVLFNKNGKKLAETTEVSDTTFTSGTVGLYSGGSGTSSYFDYVEERNEVNVEPSSETPSSSEVDDALNTQVAQESLNELDDPQVDRSNATKTDVYVDGKYEAKAITIPHENGKMHVEYSESGNNQAITELDKSSLSDTQVNNLSSNVGWPDSKPGVLMHSDDTATPHFGRHATDAEEQECVANAGLDALPIDTVAWDDTDSTGRYQMNTEHMICYMDETREQVVDEEDPGTTEDTDCGKTFSLCVLDLTSVYTGCDTAGTACGMAIGMTGGTIGTVACVTGVAAICLPNVYNYYASGSCRKWYDECN